MGQLASQNTLHTFYLFPGQGSDGRIFEKIKPDSSSRLVVLSYPIPPKQCSMKAYALLIAKQIDTTGRYSFIGVSLGGMLSVELADVLKPENVILISSAKTRAELPFRYRFQKYVPLYRLIPKGLVKLGALMLQPLVEPDRNKRKAVFKSMLRSKDKRYLKRSIGLIVNWDRKTYRPGIIHIHGDKDHTLPVRNINTGLVVPNGSHMMTLTRGGEINRLIISALTTAPQP